MPQPLDTGRVTAGARGKLFRSDGSRWGHCTQWALNGTVTSTDEQPLGSFWPIAVPQSLSASLTVSELVIDDDIPRQVLEGIADIANPHLPTFRFIGERDIGDDVVLTMIDGCTVDGTFPIADAIPGQTMTRDFTFRVQNPPEPSGLLPRSS
jgi:hypothetical protein